MAAVTKISTKFLKAYDNLRMAFIPLLSGPCCHGPIAFAIWLNDRCAGEGALEFPSTGALQMPARS